MSQSPFLIIGATGTNGRSVVDSLEKKNIPVRALVRNRDAARRVFSTSVELVEGDLTQPESLRRAFAGVDKAFVVTAVQPNTVELFKNVYAAAREANVSQLVKFSGLGASASSPSEIMREHGASDDLLRESGVPFTIIRPNSFHQNMLWQAQSVAQTDQFYLPLADAAQSTIDVRDIADIVVNIMIEDGHVGKSYGSDRS
ncbi:SDR family oxidoreductase [uncultured Roseobacter sp.]|uniref:SDR family oxidoreductase n=1 Tax=uncultured Roseobacter sp. TaxID=114847 RepID=UPI00261A92CA|nr:NAD(P)H-binding protein [uncultured Roseobacter sp.]